MIKKLLLGAMITSSALFALPNNELQLSMLAKAAQKKAVVLSTMRLKGETKEQFGKLYDEYQEKLMEKGMKHIGLIRNYAANYAQMTNETSDQLIIKWAELQEAELKLKKEYILKFRKFLPSAEVMRYFQIENRFNILRKAKIIKMIPLATPPKLSADMAIVTTDVVEITTENNQSN